MTHLPRLLTRPRALGVGMLAFLLTVGALAALPAVQADAEEASAHLRANTYEIAYESTWNLTRDQVAERAPAVLRALDAPNEWTPLAQDELEAVQRFLHDLRAYDALHTNGTDYSFHYTEHDPDETMTTQGGSADEPVSSDDEAAGDAGSEGPFAPGEGLMATEIQQDQRELALWQTTVGTLEQDFPVVARAVASPWALIGFTEDERGQVEAYFQYMEDQGYDGLFVDGQAYQVSIAMASTGGLPEGGADPAAQNGVADEDAVGEANGLAAYLMLLGVGAALIAMRRL